MQGATFQKVHPECHEVGLEGTLNSISLEESVLWSVSTQWMSPISLIHICYGWGMSPEIRYKEDSSHGVCRWGVGEQRRCREEWTGRLILVNVGGYIWLDLWSLLREKARHPGRHCFEAKDIRGQGEQMSRKMSRREGSQKDTQMTVNSCGRSRNSAPSGCSFDLSLGFPWVLFLLLCRREGVMCPSFWPESSFLAEGHWQVQPLLPRAGWDGQWRVCSMAWIEIWILASYIFFFFPISSDPGCLRDCYTEVDLGY